MTSATSRSNVDPCGKPKATSHQQTSGLNVASKMLRSPSHESVTTDLSLFTVSSLESELPGVGEKTQIAAFKPHREAQLTARGPSPNPPVKPPRPPDIPEILWLEEENDLIISCAALSSALGFQKSFSTSDISNLPSPDEILTHPRRCTVSDLALSALQRSGYFFDNSRLDYASRSCSTWVAVGNVASTSQLPSPHGGHAVPSAPNAVATAIHNNPTTFSAADLVRSVNKKVRQNYIRRKLLTTYKALERLSQSEFNLDQLEIRVTSDAARQASSNLLTVPGTRPASKPILPPNSLFRLIKPDSFRNKKLPLTLRDVERDRGKPLSKYERNMMIFNWLHTLDDTIIDSSQ